MSLPKWWNISKSDNHVKLLDMYSRGDLNHDTFYHQMKPQGKPRGKKIANRYVYVMCRNRHIVYLLQESSNDQYTVDVIGKPSAIYLKYNLTIPNSQPSKAVSKLCEYTNWDGRCYNFNGWEEDLKRLLSALVDEGYTEIFLFTKWPRFLRDLLILGLHYNYSSYVQSILTNVGRDDIVWKHLSIDSRVNLPSYPKWLLNKGVLSFDTVSGLSRFKKFKCFDKLIYLFGDIHVRSRSGVCSSSELDICDFFRIVMDQAAEEKRVLDIYCEITIEPTKLYYDDDVNDIYFTQASRLFKQCVNTPCKIPHRIHSIDIRGDVSIRKAFSCIELLIENVNKCILIAFSHGSHKKECRRYYMEFLHAYVMAYPYVHSVDVHSVFIYYTVKLYKIDKQFTSINPVKYPGVEQILRNEFIKALKPLEGQTWNSMIKILSNAKNPMIMPLFKMLVCLNDIYTLARMFRSFDHKKPDEYAEDASSIIIYTGYSHTENISDLLISMKAQLLDTGTDSIVNKERTQCVKSATLNNLDLFKNQKFIPLDKKIRRLNINPYSYPQLISLNMKYPNLDFYTKISSLIDFPYNDKYLNKIRKNLNAIHTYQLAYGCKILNKPVLTAKYYSDEEYIEAVMQTVLTYECP